MFDKKYNELCDLFADRKKPMEIFYRRIESNSIWLLVLINFSSSSSYMFLLNQVHN